MPFGEHLEELRRRLIYALWGVVPILILALSYGKRMLEALLIPIVQALRDADLSSSLIATGPLESFMTYFKLTLTVTILVSSPWILMQLWLFVAPGLYHNERRFAYLLAPLSIFLTVTGVTFCYKVIFPITLAFLINFGSSIAQPDVTIAPLPAGVTLPQFPALASDPADPPEHSMWYNSTLKQLRFCAAYHGKIPVILGTNLVAGGAIAQQYRVSEYVGLLLSLCLAFALAFQMPVAVLILGWAGIVEIALLAKYRRHAVFACAFLGALLTPTLDPFTMFLLACPLYLLYEFGILLLRILPASRVAQGFKKSSAEADGDPDHIDS